MSNAPPDMTQQAILNAIPILNADDLEAYSQMASPNWLFPQGPSAGGDLQVFPHDLPTECNVEKRPNHGSENYGDVPAYSYVIRFTMIQDDDPYGQGIPPGTVGYWTHDGQGCHIDSQNQIHGIKWVGHNSGLAITSQQEWIVELLLFGANCGWPTNWDAFYNGYVNAILNSVWRVDGPQSPTTMLRDTCGEWRTDGWISRANSTRRPDWVVSNTMWSPIFSKIWPQSQNASIRPGIHGDLLLDGDNRSRLKALGWDLVSNHDDVLVNERLKVLRLRLSDTMDVVINRRLI